MAYLVVSFELLLMEHIDSEFFELFEEQVVLLRLAEQP